MANYTIPSGGSYSTAGASNITGTTTGSFTPAVGDVLVVFCVAEGNTTWTAPTSSGLVFTSRVTDNTASTCSTQMWTAPVTAGQNVSRTVAMGACGTANRHSAVLFWVTGGVLAATPATMDVRGTGAPTGTLTTVGAGSLLLWSNGDFAAVAPGTPAYRSGAVQDFIDDQSTTFYVGYYAHQTSGAPGAQTVGQTAPTGQTYKLVGIEILNAPMTVQPARGLRRFLPRRRVATAQPVPAQVVVQTTQALPPQAGRRKPWLAPRVRSRRTQLPLPVVVTVTTQALPPQPTRDRLTPQLRRRAFATTVTVTTAPIPAQPVRDRLTPTLRRHSFTATPLPVVVTVTTQALPAQPGRRRFGFLPKAKARTSAPVPAQVVVVTAQALPPQPARRHNPLLGLKRGRVAEVRPPQVTVTLTPAPPQPQRRRAFLPQLRRAEVTQPVRATVVVATPLPPQPGRRLARLVRPRRGTSTTPFAAAAVAPQVILRITGLDVTAPGGGLEVTTRGGSATLTVAPGGGSVEVTLATGSLDITPTSGNSRLDVT